MLRQFLFLSFLLSPYIWASDPRRTPENTAARQDLERILTDSPWTQQVKATMDDPADKPEISTEVPREITQAGQPDAARQATTPRWDGGIGKNRMGHLATIPVVVRWDSAGVVRHALESQHDSGIAALNAASPGNFVISVAGLLPASQVKNPATLQKKSSSDDETTARTTEETLEWFMSNSKLLVKGFPVMQPQNVTIDSDSGTIRLFFKRSDALPSHKRDIYFVTRFGAMNVQVKFRTKDMLVDGQPDL